MKNINKFGIITISIFLTSMSIALVSAQLDTATSKRYTTCINSIPELDTMNLRYDIVGCPVSDIIIHDYDRLSDTDKQNINSTLTSKGYVEKEEINSDTGKVITTAK